MASLRALLAVPLSLTAALTLSGAAACGPRGDARGRAPEPEPSQLQAGGGRTEPPCGEDQVCWYTTPGCGPDVRCTCGPPDPDCKRSHVVCGCGSASTLLGSCKPGRAPEPFQSAGPCAPSGSQAR